MFFRTAEADARRGWHEQRLAVRRALATGRELLTDPAGHRREPWAPPPGR